MSNLSKRLKLNTQQGFTLIEMIVVIALMAISIGVSSDIILTLIKSYTKTQVGTEIEQNANFASLKLEKELKSATSITSVTGNAITFTDKTGTSVTYQLTGNTLYRGVDPITNGDPNYGVDVICNDNSPSLNGGCDASPACFKQLSDTPYTVRINLAFKRKANPNDLDTVAKVCSTVVLRGSY